MNGLVEKMWQPRKPHRRRFEAADGRRKVPASSQLSHPRFSLIIFKHPLSPTQNNPSSRIITKTSFQDLKRKIYCTISHITIRKNKKMNPRASSLTLTGRTSTSSADNAPNKSDTTKAWNYTDLLAGNGLPPYLFFFPPPFPFHITYPPAPIGNFPIPFRSHSPTCKKRNDSTQFQFHQTTENEGEAKDAITKPAKMKKRKVAGHFQAGREGEKRNLDGGHGSFSFRLPLCHLAPFSQRKDRRSLVLEI